MSHAAPAHHGHDDGPLMAHGSVLQTGITNGKIAMWLFLGSELMFFTGLIGAYIILRFGQDTWADPLAADYPLNIPLTAFNTFLLICSSVTLVYGLQHIQAGNRSKGNLGLLATTLFGAIFVGVQAYEYYELWHQTDPVHELRHDIESNPSLQNNAVLQAVLPAMEKHFADAYKAMNGERWAGGKNPTNLDLTRTFVVAPRDPAQQQALQGWLEARFPAEFGKQHIDDAHGKKAESHGHGHGFKKPTRPHSDLFAACFYAMTGFHGLHVFLGVVCLVVLTVRGYLGDFGPKNYAVVELTGLYWHFVDLVWIVLFAIVYLM